MSYLNLQHHELFGGRLSYFWQVVPVEYQGLE